MCVVGTWGRVGRGDVGRGTWQAACCRHEVASEGASLRAVLGKGAGLSAAWDISAWFSVARDERRVGNKCGDTQARLSKSKEAWSYPGRIWEYVAACPVVVRSPWLLPSSNTPSFQGKGCLPASPLHPRSCRDNPLLPNPPSSRDEQEQSRDRRRLTIVPLALMRGTWGWGGPTRRSRGVGASVEMLSRE